MSRWYNRESDIHKRAYQQLTNRVVFGETNDNVIYLKDVLSVGHNTEEAHLRDGWIARVDSHVQLILEQYRLPGHFGISGDLQLERDLYRTFITDSSHFFDVHIVALSRE